MGIIGIALLAAAAPTAPAAPPARPLNALLAPPSPVADRLPTRLTTFIGRDDELKLLAELLGGARL
ncbi:hypothetical protein, partial [Amycolatopsis solani]|uniref:hypothetical protein n=1 Tax=Amycolatopsis solani TaxID=3028615 RepID=UPI0025B19E09